LVGFTKIEKPLSPSDTFHLQKRYLSEYSSVLISCGAEIDYYHGSSLLAFWDHSILENNLNVVSFISKLRIADEQLQQEYLSFGLPYFRTQNGMATGEVQFGNIGTQYRGKYSLFGSEVNKVVRMAQGNRDYETHILLDEETVNLNPDISEFEFLQELNIKGSTKRLRIYTIK